MPVKFDTQNKSFIGNRFFDGLAFLAAPLLLDKVKLIAMEYSTKGLLHL